MVQKKDQEMIRQGHSKDIIGSPLWGTLERINSHVNERDQHLLRGELREKREGGKKRRKRRNPESIYMRFLK